MNKNKKESPHRSGRVAWWYVGLIITALLILLSIVYAALLVGLSLLTGEGFPRDGLFFGLVILAVVLGAAWIAIWAAKQRNPDCVENILNEPTKGKYKSTRKQR